MKKKTVGALLSIAACSSVLLYAQPAFAANDGEDKVQTSVELTSGGITLIKGADFSFASKALSATAQVTDAATISPVLDTTSGTGSLKVNDLRGGTTGWYVEGYATKMTKNIAPQQGATLPITSLKLRVQNESLNSTGQVVGNGAFVDIYDSSQDASAGYNGGASAVTFCQGPADSNGLHTTGDLDAKLSLGATDKTLAGDYSGQIHFQLVDANLPTP